MRKYHVIDDDGSEYQVEELDEELIEEAHDEEPIVNALSAEEIKALKKLAAVADKLLAIIAAKDSDNGMEENNLVKKNEDNEELEDEDEDEKVIDTDEDLEDEEEEEKKPVHDSKKSFGSLESKKKAKVVDNSLTDEVSDAWAKRYGGIK